MARMPEPVLFTCGGEVRRGGQDKDLALAGAGLGSAGGTGSRYETCPLHKLRRPSKKPASGSSAALLAPCCRRAHTHARTRTHTHTGAHTRTHTHLHHLDHHVAAHALQAHHKVVGADQALRGGGVHRLVQQVVCRGQVCVCVCEGWGCSGCVCSCGRVRVFMCVVVCAGGVAPAHVGKRRPWLAGCHTVGWAIRHAESGWRRHHQGAPLHAARPARRGRGRTEAAGHKIT